MRVIMKVLIFFCALALRLLCLPIAAVLYLAAAVSERATVALISLIITLEYAKNPDDAETETEEEQYL